MLETKNSSDRFSVSKESGGALKFNNRSQDSKKVFEKRFFNTPPPKKKKLYNGDSVKKIQKQTDVFFCSPWSFFEGGRLMHVALLSGVTKNQSAESPLVPDAQSHRPSLVLYQCHHFNQFLHDYLLEQELCSLVASWWLPFSQSMWFRWINFFGWSLWLGRRLLCCSPSLACSRMCNSRSVHENKMCYLNPSISTRIMDMIKKPDLQEIHPGKETFATEPWLLVRNSHPRQLKIGEPRKNLLTFQYCILFFFTGVLKMVCYNPLK